MRPVRRGASPQTADFVPYTTARESLVSRLGSYCSYCERRIVSQLAVEHVQPKGLCAYANLAGKWENFLLACVNCNSTKRAKDVVLADMLLPDRDNTFAAFCYLPDGTLTPSDAAKDSGLELTAKATLALTGLDQKISASADANVKLVAKERISQRMEVWLVASESKLGVDAAPHAPDLRQQVVRTAQAYGHFSVWLAVFRDDADMCNRLIDAFPGTRQSGCFDMAGAQPVSPAPNPDQLAHGGKI